MIRKHHFSLQSLAILIIAAGLILAATPRAADAGDQIRLKITNNAGFIISQTYLTAHSGDGNSLNIPNETLKKNLALGESGNVKYDIGSENGNFSFAYDIPGDSMWNKCSKPTFVNSSGGQITSFTLPNGNTKTGELDPSKDQIVRVRYDVVGTINDKKCRYKGYSVYDR